MKVFNKIIILYSFLGIITCFIFSILANIYPEQMEEGETLNAIGSLIAIFYGFLSMILLSILYFLFKKKINKLLNFSTLETILFWLSITYFIFTIIRGRSYFHVTPLPTKVPIMVFEAIGLNVNLHLFVIARYASKPFAKGCIENIKE